MGLAAVALLGLPTRAAGADRITLVGDQARTISSDTTITGPIVLQDNAVLTIIGATVRVVHPSDDPRANILLSGHARLVLTDAALLPGLGHPDNLYISAWDDSRVELTNSAFINVINLLDRASLSGTRARIASSLAPISIPETAGAFGIVQLAGQTNVTLVDSTVGSIGLFFGPDDDVSLSNLKPRTYVDFDLARDAARWSPGYNVVLKNTRVLPVRLRGPFERSWAVFTDPAAKVTIADSSLNKLVMLFFTDETLTFRDLAVDKVGTFDFRDIHLVNSSVANEWGLFGRDSNITVERCQGVWLWPIGRGTWSVRDSQMIEFDPRGLVGTLNFANGEWANAGEVFEGSDFLLKGSVAMTQRLDQHLVVNDSTIRREYSVRLIDAKGRLVQNFTVTLRRGNEVVRARSKNGRGFATIGFTAANYRKPVILSVTAPGINVQKTISLFTATPIVLRAKR